MADTSRVPDTSSFPLDQQLDKRSMATALAEMGFSVIQVNTNKKAPPSADAWQKTGYRKPNLVWESWSHSRGVSRQNNIGIVPNGRFFILDFDKAKGGCESLEKLDALDKLPDTFRVKTQSGGYHLYFACDKELSNGSSVLDHISLPGVDVRTIGGYAIAPGGTIVDKDGTRHYKALNSLPMAPAPDWLVDALSVRRKPAAPKDREAPAVELDTPENIEIAVNHLRNDAPPNGAFAVACWVRDLGISEPEAVGLMLEHWLPDRARGREEITEKVNHAFSYAQNRHGIKAAALPQHEFPPLSEAEIAAINAQPKPDIKPYTIKQRKQDSRAKPATLIERWQDVTEPDTEWLIEGIIPKNAFATLYGQPGSYKSFVALYLAAMLADGRSAFGRRTRPSNGEVLYVAAEGGSGLRKRLDAIERLHEIHPSNVGFVRHPLDLRGSLAHCDELLKAIAEGGWKPDLIVIDTLARSFGGGNENSSEDMGAFINIIDYIRTQTGAAVLVVHHSGKDTAKGMRGHSALFGAVDSELEVEKIRNAPEEGPGVGGGRLKVTKQKDGPDGYSIDYAVEKVMLGGGAGSAEAEFGDGDENGTVPAQGGRSSLAVREWQDGEVRGVELTEVKLSSVEHAAIAILVGLPANEAGQVRSDVWKRGVVDRGICNENDWPKVRKSLKDVGAFSTDGGRFVTVDSTFVEMSCLENPLHSQSTVGGSVTC